MKKIIQRKVLYVCERCKTRYENRKDALWCNARPLEKKIFRIGDTVSNLEPRTCLGAGKRYIFSGKIVKISKPQPADHEYEVKWLAGKRRRLDSHVFQYEVEFFCPHCKQKKRSLYYAPELKLIP